MHDAPTIAAISTPQGPGAIGVVRLSGSGAIGVAGRVFRSLSGRDIASMRGYTGTLGRVFDQGGDIDEAIALVYRAPRSYTGEDVVELSCHGGEFVVRRLLRACLDAGAVMAAPGEFTRRAVLNGKLSLTQAEAVMDMISADSVMASRSALQVREGALYDKIAGIIHELVGISAGLAAWMDYPEEDVPEVSRETLRLELTNALVRMHGLLASYDAGKIYRSGIETAIAGRPNVGKSTLMNLLSGTRRSIVTDIPGTTRDIVEESVMVGGLTLKLADTAGLRDTDDPIEAQGVGLAWGRLETAQLILAVFDGAQPLDEGDRELIARIGDTPAVAVINKSDLGLDAGMDEIRAAFAHRVEISAKSGEGVAELEAAITAALGVRRLEAQDVTIANERQRSCVVSARAALSEALDVLDSGLTPDAADVCVVGAIDSLMTLTGEKASDKIIDEVFSKFCLGK